MFRPPSGAFMLRQWELSIGRTDKALNRNDRVCVLHFEKHFVSDRYYSEHAGNVLLDERKAPRLRKDAVPTIFEHREFIGGGGAEWGSQQDSLMAAASEQLPLGGTVRGSSPTQGASRSSTVTPTLMARTASSMDFLST
ncbi:hypothetical protein HPB50_006864 [Hyalomma asiaticum]|uniref:Uncharacterized protein n=1 Tax=Hyalomma asiaticum TaxID=266040 RepID=A0ACB7RHN0_HYAAI|nr:hypothetical protein HPB50_006864 [Hyalomma asiaticum]